MVSQPYDVIIVGAGLSGLSVARFLRDKRPETRLLVIEQNGQPGGAIRSHYEEGYLAECGAHGFLDNCLESRVIVHLAGLEAEVEKAPLKKFGRYVCLHGELKMIPQQPGAILRAPLISWTQKLRILADLWKKPLAGEPTVAQWVEYRFGKDLVPFADAVFTGTYAGDIKRLVMDGVMPGVRALEKETGSVLRGLIKKQRQKKKERKGKKSQGLPAMTSFHSGMGRLAQGLALPMEASREIMYQTTVKAVSRKDDLWQVRTGQNSFTCRHLVLALPVNAALPLLSGLDGIKPPPLAAIPEARIATVALGFSDEARIPFGFGYLAPESEERFALGALFSSHMFPGRAPEGFQLIEVLVGGRRHPERLELSDEELIDAVCRDLGGLMELSGRPTFARVLRPASAIPQFEEGYPGLLAWRRQVHAGIRTLHIAGFGWQGIGINDMTKEAWKAAKRILTMQLEEEEQEVKAVYF
jgi:oxygen-dependent protoporphyrinogen oxidase